ncbi:MAG: acyl-CoA dehydrogenase C-terminal domain-containing protein, partial [Desulfobacterales bacterium]
LAAQKLENGARKKDVAFYEGQIKSAQFFAHSILPVSTGKMNVILAADNAAIDISQDAFGGK